MKLVDYQFKPLGEPIPSLLEEREELRTAKNIANIPNFGTNRSPFAPWQTGWAELISQRLAEQHAIGQTENRREEQKSRQGERQQVRKEQVAQLIQAAAAKAEQLANTRSYTKKMKKANAEFKRELFKTDRQIAHAIKKGLQATARTLIRTAKALRKTIKSNYAAVKKQKKVEKQLKAQARKDKDKVRREEAKLASAKSGDRQKAVHSFNRFLAVQHVKEEKWRKTMAKFKKQVKKSLAQAKAQIGRNERKLRLAHSNCEKSRQESETARSDGNIAEAQQLGNNASHHCYEASKLVLELEKQKESLAEFSKFNEANEEKMREMTQKQHETYRQLEKNVHQEMKQDYSSRLLHMSKISSQRDKSIALQREQARATIASTRAAYAETIRLKLAILRYYEEMRHRSETRLMSAASISKFAMDFMKEKWKAAKLAFRKTVLRRKAHEERQRRTILNMLKEVNRAKAHAAFHRKQRRMAQLEQLRVIRSQQNELKEKVRVDKKREMKRKLDEAEAQAKELRADGKVSEAEQLLAETRSKYKKSMGEVRKERERELEYERRVQKELQQSRPYQPPPVAAPPPQTKDQNKEATRATIKNGMPKVETQSMFSLCGIRFVVS